MLIPFQHLLTKYNLKPTGVFHIGASVGQEAPAYAQAGVNDVVFIEAIPQVFEVLKSNLLPYPDMIPVKACISDRVGEIEFNIANNGGQSSSLLELGTHKTEHPEVHYVGKIKMKTETVVDLQRRTGFDIEDYNFLNIDLQGAELLALKGIAADLDDVLCAYIEVNKAKIYKGCPLIGDIDEYMELWGFKRVELAWCGNFSWGDAFYLRSDIKP